MGPRKPVLRPGKANRCLAGPGLCQAVSLVWFWPFQNHRQGLLRSLGCLHGHAGEGLQAERSL